MFFIFFLAASSTSTYINITISSLRFIKSPAFISKSPFLVFSKTKPDHSTLKLTNFFISKSYCPLLYSINDNKQILLNKLSIQNFLSQAIIINSLELCVNKYSGTISNFKGVFPPNNLIIEGCSFINCHSATEKGCNRGFNSGGAISFFQAYGCVISNVQFENCSAVISGGAVMIYGADTFRIENTNFTKCCVAKKSDNCTTLIGCSGAACQIQDTEKVIISGVRFIDNYIFENSSTSDFKFTLVLANCQESKLESCIFENDINVQNDVSLDFVNVGPYISDKKVSITKCCFNTKLTNSIYINEKILEPNYSIKWNVRIFSNSFNQDKESNYSKFNQGDNRLVDNRPNIYKASYCKFSFDFTESKVFTATNFFTHSNHFSQSSHFSHSLKFTYSNFFTKSNAFGKSSYFTPSDGFTQTGGFSNSIEFTASADLTQSQAFSMSNPFPTSSMFTCSSGFSLSAFFTLTSYFSQSDKLTQSSQFSESENFTQSFPFTDEFYPLVVKGTKLSKGGIAGIIIACLVILAIIILLLVLFLKRKKSAFIPPEDDPMNIDGLDIPINMYD